MWWSRRRRPRTPKKASAPPEAQQAIDSARQDLERAREHTVEIRSICAALARIRQRNHFSEELRRIALGPPGVDGRVHGRHR